MKAKITVLYAALAVGWFVPAVMYAQAPPSPDAVPPAGQEAPERGIRGGQRGAGLVGKITSLQNGSMVIAKPDGQSVTVKWTDKTEFRRAREAAKLSDFKVGDGVLVRGEENDDHSWTARVIALPPADGRGGGGPVGEMGKDFVVGEVKSIDAPNLTILRTDKVTQTIELTEESSLRKGQDSITMADIQPGDHVLVRGGMQGKVFVPKMLVVIDPERWKRMEELGFGGPVPAGGGTKTKQAPPEKNR